MARLIGTAVGSLGLPSRPGTRTTLVLRDERRFAGGVAGLRPRRPLRYDVDRCALTSTAAP